MIYRWCVMYRTGLRSMYLGSMIEIGLSDDVFFDPQHPYTQLLIGSNPEPDPNHERTRASVSIPGEIPSPVQHSARVPIRVTLS